MAREVLEKGHVLNDVQAEKINEMLITIKELHQIYDNENGDMADTLNGFVQESEELLFELGLIKRKIF